jgi:3D (Asp-Asp-Asp) domain-containing protein
MVSWLYVVTLVLILVMSLSGILNQAVTAAAWEEKECNVTIIYHGNTTRTTGSTETVAQLLDRLGLEVSGEDVVSHGMDTPVRHGMQLRIDRVVTREETYTADIAHGQTLCNDASLPEGTEMVLTEGEDGEMICQAKVTYRNGLEVSREILSQKVLRQPVTEVLAVGTADTASESGSDAMPVISDGFITLPTGEVLTNTDTATVRATAYTHTDAGCDLITSTGTTVRWGTVAVDPRFIPYGTRMFIMASNGSYVYGIAVAEDCGGDIKGDRMDLYMPTYEQCIEFGRRVCTLYFLG